MKTSAKRVIVALDVESAAEAREIVSELRGEVAAFKVGLQLFTAAGPALVRDLAADNNVFLDLKFHDIPNTVAKAGVEAARLGVWMFNVHASGGADMMRKTVEEVNAVCQRESLTVPFMIGVTVLTSSGPTVLSETGVESEVLTQVVRLAELSAVSGLDGIVASPLEVRAIKTAVAQPGFLAVAPGIRTETATNDDQRRVMNSGRAVSEGADYLVIGRPILQASDRSAALREINQEIDAGVK